MKTKLLHNPSAGTEQYTKEELVSIVQSEGFSCSYASTNMKNWNEIDQDTDFIIIAGGDGTIREVAEALLSGEFSGKKLPVALLPMGTANNFAKTLGITGEAREIIRSWRNKNTRKIDIGCIHHLQEATFFIEGFGFGVIPCMMKEVKAMKKASKQVTPGKKMEMAVKTLHKVILSYPARNCRIEADGVVRDGKFLLVEIMNTRSIGPNLFLAPFANLSDGELEVVLVPEGRRNEFARYVLDPENSPEEISGMEVFKASNIKIRWDGPDVHADDELIYPDQSQEVSVVPRMHSLEFLVPAAATALPQNKMI